MYMDDIWADVVALVLPILNAPASFMEMSKRQPSARRNRPSTRSFFPNSNTRLGTIFTQSLMCAERICERISSRLLRVCNSYFVVCVRLNVYHETANSTQVPAQGAFPRMSAVIFFSRDYFFRFLVGTKRQCQRVSFLALNSVFLLHY